MELTAPAPLPFHAAPPLALFGLEPVRALAEYAAMRRMDRSALPCGDGHPVVIFPGLASSERSLAPLAACCADLGYATYDWGRGYNLGPRGDVDAWLAGLAAEIAAIVRTHDRPATLVGWSLGGIYVRELAKLMPRQVRQVITLGTPFAGGGAGTHVGWLFQWLSGRSPSLDEALARRLRTPPPVPCTSIYSRGDGIVAWRACLQSGRASHPIENVEVSGSHSGLGWNPRVLAVVADRLAQPVTAWRPYAPPTAARPVRTAAAAAALSPAASSR